MTDARPDWTPEDERLAARRAYSLSATDAGWLSGMVVSPEEFRKMALAKYAKENGQEALINLFAQFIGAAESVVHNCHETIDLHLICEGLARPDRREDRLNLPTMFGAMLGAKLASDPKGACATCAFRIGTRANQCETTVCDAEWCASPGERPFFCHEGIADGDEPNTPCAGFVVARQRLKPVRAHLLAQDRGE